MLLNGKWKLYFYDATQININNPKEPELKNQKSIDCKVPGNVELDLAESGLLPKDIFKGMNIRLAEKYEIYDWWYEKNFKIEKEKNSGDKLILKFKGVDCFADYFLNDVFLGSSENMFIENEFDITDKVVLGKENTLYVHIKSPIITAARENIDPLELISSTHQTALAQVTRKPPHSYGWDIMPRALSAGIWRDVSIETKKKYGFNYVYFGLLSINQVTSRGIMVFNTRIPEEETFKLRKIRIYGKCKDFVIDHTAPVYSSNGKITFPLDTRSLWWPKGYGEPNIYKVTLEVYDSENNILFSENFRQGFRRVELLRSEIVEPGGKFEIRINNVKIYAIGSNWVPLDVYHSRDKEKYKKAIDLACDIGCNILRCWGGNVYEDDEFFDLCDEKGIMVWQDFAMACHFYPQTKTFAEKLGKEVESVVKKLRNHSSIILWCGDNEIDSLCGIKDYKPSVNSITRKTIPEILIRIDPLRPYLPSSPYVSDKAFELGQEYTPEAHLWGCRDYYKSNFYVNSKAYFVSETGYHGCPSEKSIRKFIDEEYVWPYSDNEQWNLHSTDQRNAPHRVKLMEKQIMQIFGKVPDNLSEYSLASQISQAEADKYFIERMRARTQETGGIIWWNLLDGWPQMSDAVVDYYFEKKLAYFYIKRSSRPVLPLIGEMGQWGYPVIVSNCSIYDKTVLIEIIDADTDNIVFSKTVNSAPNSSVNIGGIDCYRSQKGMFIIKFTVDGKSYINTYLYGTPEYDLNDYIKWMKKADDIENSL